MNFSVAYSLLLIKSFKSANVLTQYSAFEPSISLRNNAVTCEIIALKTDYG